MPLLGHLPIRSIRYATLRRIDANVKWGSAKTRTNVITALRQVFRFALEEDLVDANPAQKFRLTRRQRPDPDPYSLSERTALLAALEDTHAAFYFHVAFGTGMRTGELLALSWSDFDGESLHVRRSKVRRVEKGSTKTYQSRRVMLGADLAGMIEKHRRDVGHLFVNQYGRPYQSGYHLKQGIPLGARACGSPPPQGAVPMAAHLCFARAHRRVAATVPSQAARTQLGDVLSDLRAVDFE